MLKVAPLSPKTFTSLTAPALSISFVSKLKPLTFVVLVGLYLGCALKVILWPLELSAGYWYFIWYWIKVAVKKARASS